MKLHFILLLLILCQYCSTFKLRPIPDLVGWHTEGNQIVSAEGKTVTLKSISWFGFETNTYVVHGLSIRKLEDLLQLVKNMGFNSVRIPWSNDIMKNPIPTGVNYNVNPNLINKTALEVLDYLVDKCQSIGLWVILARYLPNQTSETDLWYTAEVPEQKWISDWKTFTARYWQKETVIALDLHNEPGKSATWGNDSASTDWNQAVTKLANAIQNGSTRWLFIIQGVKIISGDQYWSGGNLIQVSQFPIQLQVPFKFIYSPHDFGPGVKDQPWFNDDNFPNNLINVWDNHWGFISKNKTAPIWIGEFGGFLSDTTSKEGIWQNYLVDYIKQTGISFSYWCLNPDSNITGGLLYDDWTSVDSSKLIMLKRLLQ